MIAQFEKLRPEAQAFHRGFGEPTELVSLPSVAKSLGIGSLWVKDEGRRFGLQAFKAVLLSASRLKAHPPRLQVLGVSYAVQRLLEQGVIKQGCGATLCTMTDGNHGRAVAFTARRLGCRCVVFVPENMSMHRKAAIASEGTQVIEVNVSASPRLLAGSLSLRTRQGSYDDAIAEVKLRAGQEGWHLVSDQAWEGYTSVPMDIMAGYGTLFSEIDKQLAHQAPGDPPITHVVLQAGVGGFAGAGAAWLSLSKREGCVSVAEDARLIVAEPLDADCLLENMRGTPVQSVADLRACVGATESVMSGLNCAMPSTLAWPLLRDTAAAFVALDDSWALGAMRRLHRAGVVAGESGAAGVAAVMAICESQTHAEFGLDQHSRVLCVNTESDTDPDAFLGAVCECRQQGLPKPSCTFPHCELGSRGQLHS